MTKSTNHPASAVQESKVSRTLTVALPAAVITLGLFSAMHNLIDSEEIEPTDQTIYELKPFLALEEPEIVRTTATKPKRPSHIDPPPLPPALVKSAERVVLTDGYYNGSAPADYSGPEVRDIVPKRASSMISTTMLPITPPVPVYPRRALTTNREGDCTVHFSVSTRGEPFDILANCSHPIFSRAAENAVAKVKFAPKIRDGLPITVMGVVYPLEFRINP